MFDEFKHQLPDIDPDETQDWIDSLDAVVAQEGGRERAQFILWKVLKRARMQRVGLPPLVQTRYINTISPEQEPPFPGDEWMEKRIRRIVRWNAMAMVARANALYAGIGGHLSTYASSASLYEVGFNHFFRGKDNGSAGDQIFYQGHAAPGMYARAFLEGRLTKEQLDHFRRERVPGIGLPSYPHPRLMPDFWEFPTVSMGLGPINAIYQARFNRYLHARGLADTAESRVWAFLGDGETDEPEALGALSLAAREGLDNLTFVVNCNLQRLDGPVRGNGKIIQELEMVFRGAGWNVIKVIWGREWDELLAHDVDGLLLQKMNETVDGQFQKYSVEKGSYIREHFFGSDPRLKKLVEHLSDEQLWGLRRGGHDYRKLYAAYKWATEFKGAPTVILAKTVKGWTLGESFEARNVTHQLKKMDDEQLKKLRDRLELKISDAEIKDAPYYHPGPKSEELQYLEERRRALGGYLPKRVVRSKPLEVPGGDLFDEFNAGGGDKIEVSTTQAFVSILRQLLKDKTIGPRIVPIIPDEARTFGMDPLFAQLGIYAPAGQTYDPVDAKLLFKYKESKTGQLLEEGITEAGATASFTAAGTAYATHGQPMIPFYIFYSMFGFQRTADLIWSFADSRGRGFLLGATAGRTTLNGEGLQHEDGHSHVFASTVPCIRAYDPAFAYETAVIIRDGLRRMLQEGEDTFYYITLYNENYSMPPMPEGAQEGILQGLYRYRSSDARHARRVQLLGSGPILQQVLRAQELLDERFGIAADVWSATSYQQLRNDALSVERWNWLHPTEEPRQSNVERILDKVPGPIIAVSDWMKAVPDQVARWAPRPWVVLGTDGFGRSGTREDLRRHFEIDAESIALAAIQGLTRCGQAKPQEVSKAIKALGVDPAKVDPLTV